MYLKFIGDFYQLYHIPSFKSLIITSHQLLYIPDINWYKSWISESHDFYEKPFSHGFSMVFPWKSHEKTGRHQEISIADFIGGLESILGTDLEGPPRDLDVSMPGELSEPKWWKWCVCGDAKRKSFIGISWDFHGVSWDFMGFQGISGDFMEIHRDFMGSTLW